MNKQQSAAAKRLTKDILEGLESSLDENISPAAMLLGLQTAFETISQNETGEIADLCDRLFKECESLNDGSWEE